MKTLQYLGGIIDSEGHFRLRDFKRKSTTSLGAEFKLDCTSEKIVDFFISEIGLGRKYIQNRGEDRKLIYTVSIGKNQGLQIFIEKILPFLNEKYSSASIILQYLKLDRDNQKTKAEHFIKRYHNEKYESKRSIVFSYPYMAGIMDGDGYISITKQKTNKLFIKFGLEQCFKELPYFLRDKFGGNVQVRMPKKPTHRVSFIWNPKMKEAKTICENCLSYMIEKQEYAKLLVKTIDVKINLKKQGSYEKEQIIKEYNIIKLNRKEYE